jgi:hypothetical protein
LNVEIYLEIVELLFPNLSAILRLLRICSSSGALSSRSVWCLCGVRQGRFSLVQAGRFGQTLGRPLRDRSQAFLITRAPRASLPVHVAVAAFLCVFFVIRQQSSRHLPHWEHISGSLLIYSYNSYQVPCLFIYAYQVTILTMRNMENLGNL